MNPSETPSGPGSGQHSSILNDSTKTIYGPKTCQYTYFNNVKFNRPAYYHPDTTIELFHRYSYVSQADNKLQDLGNIGTSATPVFYQPPEIIGKTFGYYTYNGYAIPPPTIKLYNTKSPYTDVYSAFGGGWRYILNVAFSQSIKPNWNFGINFRRLTINKQVSSTGRGDNEVFSTSFNGYMYYWTTDSSYFVLGAFSHMFHKVNESGGIKNNNFQSLDDYFSLNTILVNLEQANDDFLKLNYLIYQQYSLSPLLTAYNDFRRNIDHDYFSEDGLSSEGGYFDRILFNKVNTFESAKSSEYFNESGLKGTFHKAFYNAFFRIRQLNYRQEHYLPDDRKAETYLGGNLRYDFDSAYFLLLSGELMQNGDHRLAADYENRLWKLSYRRTMYEASFLEENYFGNHFEWHHNYLPIQSDYASALFKIRIKNYYLMPNLTVSLIKNYVYFRLDKLPAQATGYAQLISPGFKYQLHFFKNLHWDGEGIYTIKTGNKEARDAFRIPSVFVNSQIYFEKLLFQSNLLFLAGIDAHYRNGYYAYGYNPVVQQFYIQNDFMIPGHLLADVYMNLRIDNLKLFLKMTYINEKKGSGYFATPYYIGQMKVFDFGVSWMFYD